MTFQKDNKLYKLRKSTKGKINIGDKNGQWRGNKVRYDALHGWIKRRLPKPILCENCHKRKAYDLANRSGEYKRDLSDWEWLCRKCHMQIDGRLKSLLLAAHKFNKGRKQTKEHILKRVAKMIKTKLNKNIIL